MDTLKKIFPLSFKENKDNALIVSIIIYVVAAVIFGLALWLIGYLTLIPVVGDVIAVILRIVSTIIEIYIIIGIVLAALKIAKVIE